ncbi:MAG: hypothetical protein ACREK6_13415, partial [Candidatus Rokuibacteriota bacterium]
MSAIAAPPVALGTLLPTLIVLGTALLVLLLDLLPPRSSKTHLGLVTLGGVIGAQLATLAVWGGRGRGFRDMIILDNYALFFHLVITYAAAL